MKKSIRFFLIFCLIVGSFFLSQEMAFAGKMNGISPEFSESYSNTSNSDIQWNHWGKLNSAQGEDSSQVSSVATATNTTTPASNGLADVGIQLDTTCLVEGGCGMDIYQAMDIRKDRTERTSVMNFVQDILLGATYFIWTVVAVALMYSGYLYIMSATDASYKKKAQEGMKYALIGMIVVTLALVIVRLVQFLARGGA